MGYPKYYYEKIYKPLSIFGTTINPYLNGIDRAEVYFNNLNYGKFRNKRPSRFEVIYSNLCP